MLEKIKEIANNFNHDIFVIYQMEGNTGRIIDYVVSRKEANDYQRIAKKNGFRVYIAECCKEDNSVIYW